MIDCRTLLESPNLSNQNVVTGTISERIFANGKEKGRNFTKHMKEDHKQKRISEQIDFSLPVLQYFKFLHNAGYEDYKLWYCTKCRCIRLVVAFRLV